MPVPIDVRVGISLPPDLPIRRQAELAQWAENSGFSDVWCGEISDPDPFVVLATAALATTKVRLGTAITPIGLRTIPALGAAAASLAELAPGRVVLGIGASSRVIVEDWNGVHYANPLDRVRQSMIALRSVVAGQKTDEWHSQVRTRGFRLRRPPKGPLPLFLAALNEHMLELAGELADGVWLNLVPPEAMDSVLRPIARGARRGGRPRPPEVLLSVPCWVTDTPTSAREGVRRELAFYLTSPAYMRALSWYGFEDEIDNARLAWGERDFSKLVAAVSDRLVDAVAAVGSLGYCRERLRAYQNTGVDTLAISARGPDPYITLGQLRPSGL